MSYLPYLFLFAYSGVQHILCCVFVLSFSVAIFSGLSVHFNCPFSNVYLYSILSSVHNSDASVFLYFTLYVLNRHAHRIIFELVHRISPFSLTLNPIYNC